VNAATVGLLGLLIGLFGVLAGMLATVVGIALAVLVQWREDQRAHQTERWKQATAKRERLRAEFEKVLTGAYSFESMTSPFVWVNPETLPPGDYKDQLTKLVDGAYSGLRMADVRLRLEGATEVVQAVHQLTVEFRHFQRGLVGHARYSDPTVIELWERAQKIQALVAPLDANLQRQLDALTPPEPLPERMGFRQWAAEILAWFRR
jgi:hypothetical protein